MTLPLAATAPRRLYVEVGSVAALTPEQREGLRALLANVTAPRRREREKEQAA